jgi:hypothetical protein
MLLSYSDDEYGQSHSSIQLAVVVAAVGKYCVLMARHTRLETVCAG